MLSCMINEQEQTKREALQMLAQQSVIIMSPRARDVESYDRP